MSKLLQLKEWVSIGEAAAHLSQALSESVSEADVYRFALGRLLLMSVFIPNGLGARRWEPVSADMAEQDCGRLPLVGEFLVGKASQQAVICHGGLYFRLMKMQGLGYVFFEDPIVLDLPMIGSERDEIVRELQQHVDGVERPATRLDGFIYLIGPGGMLCIAEDITTRALAGELERPDGPAYLGLVPRKITRLTDAGFFVVRPSALADFVVRVAAGDVLDTKQEGASAPTKVGSVHRAAAKADALWPLIDLAVAAASDPENPSAVWAQLEALARQEPAPPPLVGVTSGGVQYREGGALETFTRRALGDRLRRRAKPR